MLGLTGDLYSCKATCMTVSDCLSFFLSQLMVASANGQLGVYARSHAALELGLDHETVQTPPQHMEERTVLGVQQKHKVAMSAVVHRKLVVTQNGPTGALVH